MLNSKGDKFVCQVSKLEVEKRFFIPVGKKGEGKLGCFADANCALYALEKGKTRGYEVRIGRLLKALGAGADVVVYRPDDITTWTLDNPNRLLDDKFMQSVDDYKAELAQVRQVTAARKRKIDDDDAQPQPADDDADNEAGVPPPLPPPPLPREPPRPLPQLTQPLIRVQITHRDRIADSTEVHYTHDVRQLLREKAGLFQLDSTIPMSFTGTPNQIVVYPRLVNDPRHLRATPVVATISYPSAMGSESLLPAARGDDN